MPRAEGSIWALVEPPAAEDHWHTLLRPRCPRIRLLRARDMKDVRLPPSRRESFECRLQLWSRIQPHLQLLGNHILRSLLEGNLFSRLLDLDGFVDVTPQGRLQRRNFF